MAMKTKRTVFPYFLFILVISLLFCSARAYDFYHLINMSGEDLFFTIRYTPRWRIWGDDDKRLYKHHEDCLLFYTEPDITVEITGDDFQWVFNSTVSAIEVLRSHIKELIVYDSRGYVILTLDDIQEIEVDPEHPLSHFIIITPEKAAAGLQKYADKKNLNQEKQNDGYQ
jgi:hypothetical protein